MDFEQEEGNDRFQIEDKETTNIVYGNDIGNPPLVVVVQGGKNVRIFLLKIKFSLENQH